MRSQVQLRVVLAALLAPLVSPADARAQERLISPRLPDPVAVRGSRVMAAAVTTPEPGRLLSGLFLTEPGTGWVLYRPSEEEEPERIDFREFKRMYRFADPTGLVFADPRLYVYDAEKRTIWSVLLHGPEAKQESEVVSRLPKHPTHMAVSPQGLVAVIQDDEVFFLQKGNAEPIRYTRSRFPEPIELAFSSWNTLQVLDGARNTLVSITFSHLSKGEIVFKDETELPVPPEETQRKWRGMSIYQGLVYLVDETTVYAYLASDRRLVPVATRSDARAEIRQLGLTYQSLYLLEQDHIHRYARAQPVDLSLEGGPLESQRALLALYGYLHRHKLLLPRPLLARRAYPRLDELLFENRVLLASPVEPLGKAGRMLMKVMGPEQTAGEDREFMALFCALNAEVCAAAQVAGQRPSLRMPIAQGTTLRVPHVEVSSRLSKERIELDGQPLTEHLRARVASADLRRQADASLLLKLNPGWKEEDLSQRRKGPATVPVEHWAVVAAVSAPDFRDRRSELWSLTRAYPGVGLYGREAFTEQAAKSTSVAPPPPPPATPCDTLKSAHRQLVEAIRYPSTYPPLQRQPLRVGVLEYKSTVGTGHQAFCRDRAIPSWHQAANFDLVAQPDPAGYQPAADVAGTSTFDKNAHHGTHVAAIIGGRPWDCWSGLLPRARLLLIDLTDTGDVRLKIGDAVNADVKVFNVSQDFNGVQQALEDTIAYFRRKALFVAAAGNDGRNLNEAGEAAAPAPARWAAWDNVVTVTGSNWKGDVLVGKFNHGKRYVDLVAPGEDVASASESPGTYGPATGTSQAAPQVTAAAAALVDPSTVAKLSPGDAKARLIATARWEDAYKDVLWGGRLDFAAAVRYPDRSFLMTTTGAQLSPPQLHSITVDNDPWIQITNAPLYYERQGVGRIALPRIRFDWILSLRKRADGKFRAVFREPETGHLKILLDAQLRNAEKIKCDGKRFVPERVEPFEPSTVCAEDLTIDQVHEYFRGGPSHIEWGQ